MAAPVITLNNGQKFPVLGLGTWQSKPGEVEEAVKYAINIGYRHFDCAMLYGNEKEIGDGIREKIADGTVKREDLFIVTKLWNTFHEREQVVPTCKQSLKNFGLDYIDQYLVHWPVAQKLDREFNFSSASSPFDVSAKFDYDYCETWKGMEECVKLGLTKGIGLSNFNSKQIERVLSAAIIKPVVNQIEVTPYLNQKKLIKFCKERDIAITAYSPFGSPARPWAKPGDVASSLNDVTLVSIASKYGKTTSQIILRYLIDIGTVPIPKSSNKDRIRQNLDVFDFTLAEEDISKIDALNINWRSVSADELKGLPHFPFSDDVEF